MTWRGKDDDRDAVKLLYRAIRDAQAQPGQADLVSIRRHPEGLLLAGSRDELADLGALLLEAAPLLLARPERCGQLGAIGTAIFVALGRPADEEPLQVAALRESGGG